MVRCWIYVKERKRGIRLKLRVADVEKYGEPAWTGWRTAFESETIACVCGEKSEMRRDREQSGPRDLNTDSIEEVTTTLPCLCSPV
jgi:hypothetical protein